MAYDHKDYFFHKAKKENYAARSIFKLEEIDQRFRIIHPGQKVLDLGAAPGSWAQYCVKRIGLKGRLLGVDLQPVRYTFQNAVFIEADMRQLNLADTMTAAGIAPPFDVVLSDMAPRTTGIRIQDQVRSLELCEIALEQVERFLKPNGAFVCKMFHSEEFEGYRDKLRKRFGRVEILRPKSTRKESKEIFFVALQFKGGKKPATAPAAGDEMG